MQDANVESLRNEIRKDRLTNIRFWFVVFVWSLLFFVPDFKSIFNSMNIELPLFTKVALASGDILEPFRFLLIPALWIGFRVFEDRWLKRQSLARTGTIARLAFLVVLALAYAMYMPMLKLINNVG